jgi:hypothetical protein
MRELFLPFSPDPPIGLLSGYKCEVQGPVCPPQAICILPSFTLCALQPTFTAAVTSSSAAAARRFRRPWRERARSFLRMCGLVPR